MKRCPDTKNACTRKLQQPVSGLQMLRGKRMRRRSIKREQLERLAPLIQQELRKLALRGAVSPPAALRQIFIALYGDPHRGSSDRRVFLSVTAPLVRRVAIDIAPAGERFEDCEISVAELGAWLARLDTIDSTTARIIDLYCFAGASLKETAAVMGLPTQTVTGALRAAFATLKSRESRWNGASGNGVVGTGQRHKDSRR